jgi:hypothetical protein
VARASKLRALFVTLRSVDLRWLVDFVRRSANG